MVTSLLVVGWLQAQDRDQKRDRDQDRIHQHLMLKDGKMYQIEGQQMTQLQAQQKLANGCVVNPDGTYQFQNKKKQQLKNGECLDMQGNRFKSQQEFQQQMQNRERAMAQEHLVYQGGQMYQVRNQERVQLKEQVKLADGSKVNPDGTWLHKDGTKQQLRNGECLDMAGKRYENQDRFCDKMEQRMNKESKMNTQKGPAEKGKQGGKKGNN